MKSKTITMNACIVNLATHYGEGGMELHLEVAIGNDKETVVVKIDDIPRNGSPVRGGDLPLD